jgi:hypothetical protein
LPAAEVTKDLLTDFYSQHLDELTGPAPSVDLNLTSIAPSRAQMQCR